MFEPTCTEQPRPIYDLHLQHDRAQLQSWVKDFIVRDMQRNVNFKVIHIKSKGAFMTTTYYVPSWVAAVMLHMTDDHSNSEHWSLEEKTQKKEDLATAFNINARKRPVLDQWYHAPGVTQGNQSPLPCSWNLEVHPWINSLLSQASHYYFPRVSDLPVIAILPTPRGSIKIPQALRTEGT